MTDLQLAIILSKRIYNAWDFYCNPQIGVK